MGGHRTTHYAILYAAIIPLIALYLTPSPTGIGTHTQLGLPPCPLLWATGIRCPTCGLTTSISLLFHGALRESLAAHPMGIVMATTWVAWLKRTWVMPTTIALTGLCLTTWGLRLL